MVLCRKNRPCGLKFGGCGGGGGGGGGSGSGSQAVAAATSATLPASCGQQAHLAATHCSSNGFSGSGLHDFHDGKLSQQQLVQQAQQHLYSECEGETAQLPNVGPTRVLDHLYIGSQADSLDADVMTRFGITHVLNVSVACPQSQHVPEGNFLRIPVNDGYTDKLLPHFQRAFNFLEKVRESSGRCLVHCLAGISRSPTLSIAYIMKHWTMSQDEAYRFVKQRRQHISPNFNFLGQLLEFERQLRRATASTEACVPPPADDRRPEAKRQRTGASSPTVHAPVSLPSSAVPAFSTLILPRRPRSVLIAPSQVVGVVSADRSDSQPVRRSRSSEAFLEDDGACDRRAPAGPVECQS